MPPKQRILIIDDDTKLSRLLKDYLSPFGFEVLAAAHPDEGLRYIKSHNLELIILDKNWVTIPRIPVS